ncbi:cellulose-binding family ii, partial [Moniliophthora roreri]
MLTPSLLVSILKGSHRERRSSSIVSAIHTQCLCYVFKPGNGVGRRNFQ